MKNQLQRLPVQSLWAPSGTHRPLAYPVATTEAVRGMIGTQDVTAGEGQGDPEVTGNQLLQHDTVSSGPVYNVNETG